MSLCTFHMRVSMSHAMKLSTNFGIKHYKGTVVTGKHFPSRSGIIHASSVKLKGLKFSVTLTSNSSHFNLFYPIF